MGARRIDSRFVKLHRSYSIVEAARLLGVHKNTIVNWLNRGLKPIDRFRPILIQGSELHRFLQERRKKRKSPCSSDEIWCFKCRQPRRPAAGLVDYQAITLNSGNISGLCPVCSCLMFRRISETQLYSIAKNFDVAFPQAQSRLRDSPSPSLNCAFEGAADERANIQR
jgi:hypothetical protein